jgi:head-tail adaptor
MPGDPAIVQSKIAAEVRTATGQRLERLFASSVQAQATHVVRIYAPRSWRLEHTDRLIWHDDVLGDRTLHIAGLVDPDGRHRELVIAALEQRA